MMLNTDMYVETLQNLIDRRTKMLDETPNTFENRDTLRDQTLKLLVLYRLEAQNDLLVMTRSECKERDMEHSRKKLKKQGITSPLLDKRIDHHRHLKHIAVLMLISKGKVIDALLQYWKLMGATLDDLCNLCNTTPQAMAKMVNEPSDMPFMILLCKHDAEGKYDGWVSPEDTPMTHAIKFWMSNEIMKGENHEKG